MVLSLLMLVSVQPYLRHDMRTDAERALSASAGGTFTFSAGMYLIFGFAPGLAQRSAWELSSSKSYWSCAEMGNNSRTVCTCSRCR